MNAPETLLAFPTHIPVLPQAKVVRIALESSAQADHADPRVLRLQYHRRLLILLEYAGALDGEDGLQDITLSASRVDESIFSALPEKRPFAGIGCSCAWLPEISLEGRLAIDDVVPVPWRQVFDNVHYPSRAAVAVGTLSKNSKLLLPPGIEDAEPGRQYFICGESIRTTDTFPNRPGGGTRMVA